MKAIQKEKGSKQHTSQVSAENLKPLNINSSSWVAERILQLKELD